ERLKEGEVAGIDERDRDRSIGEPLGRLDPAEPASDDHDAMRGWTDRQTLARRHAESIRRRPSRGSDRRRDRAPPAWTWARDPRAVAGGGSVELSMSRSRSGRPLDPTRP